MREPRQVVLLTAIAGTNANVFHFGGRVLLLRAVRMTWRPHRNLLAWGSSDMHNADAPSDEYNQKQPAIRVSIIEYLKVRCDARGASSPLCPILIAAGPRGTEGGRRRRRQEARRPADAGGVRWR